MDRPSKTVGFSKYITEVLNKIINQSIKTIGKLVMEKC